MAPLFFLYFQNVLRFCFENRFIKCSLVLSFETLTLLYFASRICSQCCMLHVLKSEVFIRGGGKGGGRGTRPPLPKFSGSTPEPPFHTYNLDFPNFKSPICKIKLPKKFMPHMAHTSIGV